MKVSDLALPPAKILLYGPAGTGKTALTGTAGEILQLCDLDRGTRTLAQFQDKWTEKRRAVDVIECHEDLGTVGSALTRLKAHLGTVQSEIASKKYPFKILAVDSLTTLGESALRRIVGPPAANKTPTQKDWGDAIREIANVLAVLRALPIHVILIAHQQIEEIDNQNKILVNVIGKKLPPEVPVYFDEVWYARANPIADKVEFVLQTVRSSSIEARSRNCLPNNTKQDDGIIAILDKIGYKL